MHLDARIGGGPRIHLRVCLFFDRSDDDLKPGRARRFQPQKGKAPIPGNQSQFCGRVYFKTPRCDFSMNSTR